METNEYDNRVISEMCSIICTHHKTAQWLVIRKQPSFPGDTYETDSVRWYDHLRHTTMEKFDNNGKGWYFRFDCDNKICYKYNLSIT